MKFRNNSTILAMAGVGLLASPAMGAVNLGAGDLAVVFYQVTGGGASAVVSPNTYVYELGAASLYRENALYNVSVTAVNPALGSSNIGADLVAAFGANWYNNTGVRWMVVGSVGQAESVTVGDPASTAYYSKGSSNFNTIPPAFLMGDAERASLITSLAGFRAGTNGAIQIPGLNTDGAFIGKSNTNSIEEFVPSDSSGPLDYFGTSFDPRQTFGSGTILNPPPGVGVEEGSLNLYRFINTTSGADLTGGPMSPLASVGQGQYIGTLMIDSTGSMSVIPEPSAMLLGLVGSLGLCFNRRRND